MTINIDVLLSSLKSFVDEKSWHVFKQSPIDHGLQVIITNGIERIPVNLFTTGSIVVQGKKSEMQAALKEWANLQRAGLAIPQPDVKPHLNRSAKFLVPLDKIDDP